MNKNFFMSGRPGSNWRHSAWKADALPTELLPQINYRNKFIKFYSITNIFSSLL